MSRQTNSKVVELIDEDNLEDIVPNPRKSRKRPAEDDDEVVMILNVDQPFVLPRHAQRAIKSIMDNNQDFEDDLVTAAVKAYCKQNPNTYNIDEVAGGALGMLLDGFTPTQQQAPSSSGNGEAGVDDDFMEIIEENERNPVNEILCIFPDASADELEKLLERFHDNVEQVVSHMMEKGYEKTKKPSSPLKGAANKVDKDFTSAAWETSTQYRMDAIVELSNNFPFIAKASLEKAFKSERSHYYHTLKKLEDWTKVQPRMYFRGESFVSSLHFTKETIAKIKASLDEAENNIPVKLSLRMAAKNLPRPSRDMDEVLEAEVEYIRRKRAEENEQKDKKIAEELNYQLAEEEHALMECGCCYSEYPFEALVQCTEAHLFCKTCLQHYAEQTVFGNGQSVLKCMHSSGAEQCPGIFTETMLRQSLPEKVLSKYSEAQMRDVLKGAEIDDLVSCHNCDFQASMGEDAGKVLHCPMCNLDTCRECGEVAHIPLKCSEVEKKGDTHKRLTVEEAMTKARIRICPNPKCKQAFYKTEGCSKMTCSCGFLICYVCRADITKIGYAHFCQTAHCNHSTCGKCKLYTSTVEDDMQAMKEAGLKTLQELGEDGDGKEGEGVKIDLDKYLEKPVAGPAAGARAMPGMPGFPAGFPNMAV
jgi:adenylate kinase family enzyme